MDPTVVFTMFAAAISALAGAIVFLYKAGQAREREADGENDDLWKVRVKEWKDLYEKKAEECESVRRVAAEEAKANAATMREVADVMKILPRRREDWARLSEQPS
jgi:predicted aconitase